MDPAGVGTLSRTGVRGWTWAQSYCALIGAGIAARGIVGALAGDYDLPGDGWHQLFHLMSGLALVAVARRANWAFTGAIAFGVSYAVFAIVGFSGAGDIAGVIEIEPGSNILHIVFAGLAFAAAFATRGGVRAP